MCYSSRQPRYVEDEYVPDYRITVDLDFSQKKLRLSSDRQLNLQATKVFKMWARWCRASWLGDNVFHPQLWDVPGNERFRRPGGLTGVYYRHSQGAMVTTDLARRQTFLTARAWVEDFLASSDVVDNWGEDQPAPILLVGNKSDLQNVTVNREEYNAFVEEQNLLGFFEVSARDNTNVSVAVRSLVDSVLATNPLFQL